VLETVALQKVLNEELLRCKAANPSYSLRSLARRLKISPAMLSLVLNGRRPASRKLAQKVSRSLNLDPTEENELLALFDFKTQKIRRPAPELRLQADQFRLIADWHYFAILSLLEIPGHKAQATWIARRLGISSTLAADALDRLERLGLIQADKRSGYCLTGRTFTTSDEIASSAIKKNHAQMLELAKESLDHDPLDLRDFLSITMAIDPAKIPQAKLLLREFRERLSTFLESGKKAEVYALALQLIPLSKR
jgi:uncharacterized protein (TIGR02147 family)